MTKHFKRWTDGSGNTVFVNARQVTRAVEVPGSPKHTWIYFDSSEYILVDADINQVGGWLLTTE